MTSVNSDAKLPIDESVKLPPSVQAQIDAANATHAAAYAPEPSPQPDPAAAEPSPQPDPQPQPVQVAPQPEAPAPEAAPQPAQPHDGYPDKNAQLSSPQWRHEYLSMKGRYEQATQTLGSMQEQMTEMGDEIIRLQQVLRQAPQQGQPQSQQPQSLLTEADQQIAGPEMLDLIQRAAKAALLPELQQHQQVVRNIQQTQSRAATQQIHNALFDAVPDWVAINRSPRFKSWCGSRDIYSGMPKGELLRRAFAAGDTARVIAFFKGFLSEEQATGQQPSDQSGQPYPNTPARTPAMSLEQLAAPGRAKPATGSDAPTPADKPIFTRHQISQFYADVRREAYAGREAEKNATEQAIFLAQREGRVR
jgi:hypothetical protein